MSSATAASRADSDLVEETAFTAALGHLISTELVPALPHALARAEPLPLYALTLVGTASELCPAVADAVHACGLSAHVPVALLRYAREGSVQPAMLILLLRLLESPAANRGELWDGGGLAPLFAQLLEMGAPAASPPSTMAASLGRAGSPVVGGAGGGLAHASLDVTLDSLHTLLAFMAEVPSGAGAPAEAAEGVARFWARRAAELLPASAPLVRLCHHPDTAIATKAAHCSLILARMCGEGGRASAPTEARAAFVEGETGAALRDALERDEPERGAVTQTLLAVLRAVLPAAAQ